MPKVEVVADKVEVLNVYINGVKFGVFQDIDRDSTKLSWFPSNTDRLTGDDIIAIGQALNEYNSRR